MRLAVQVQPSMMVVVVVLLLLLLLPTPEPSPNSSKPVNGNSCPGGTAENWTSPLRSQSTTLTMDEVLTAEKGIPGSLVFGLKCASTAWVSEYPKPVRLNHSPDSQGPFESKPMAPWVVVVT